MLLASTAMEERQVEASERKKTSRAEAQQDGINERTCTNKRTRTADASHTDPQTIKQPRERSLESTQKGENTDQRHIIFRFAQGLDHSLLAHLGLTERGHEAYVREIRSQAAKWWFKTTSSQARSSSSSFVHASASSSGTRLRASIVQESYSRLQYKACLLLASLRARLFRILGVSEVRLDGTEARESVPPEGFSKSEQLARIYQTHFFSACSFLTVGGMMTSCPRVPVITSE